MQYMALDYNKVMMVWHLQTVYVYGLPYECNVISLLMMSLTVCNIHSHTTLAHQSL